MYRGREGLLTEHGASFTQLNTHTRMVQGSDRETRGAGEKDSTFAVSCIPIVSATDK